MPTNDWPEIVTTEQFRRDMRDARTSRGLTQEQLGEKVGVSQNVISKLETGEQPASSTVMPICLLLGIAPPLSVFGDERMQRWAAAGYALRHLNPDAFDGQIAWVEKLVSTLPGKV